MANENFNKIKELYRLKEVPKKLKKTSFSLLLDTYNKKHQVGINFIILNPKSRGTQCFFQNWNSLYCDEIVTSTRKKATTHISTPSWSHFLIPYSHSIIFGNDQGIKFLIFVIPIRFFRFSSRTALLLIIPLFEET